MDVNVIFRAGNTVKIYLLRYTFHVAVLYSAAVDRSIQAESLVYWGIFDAVGISEQ